MMKNIFKSTLFAAAALLAACSTDNIVTDNEPKINIKIHAGFPQTRTAFGDKNEETNSYPVFWDDNDSFAIVEYIAGVESQVVQAFAENISDDRKSAEIFAELSMKRGSSFDYYAYSPYEAYSEGKMIIPAAQTPSATSVDPSALLLFASKEGLTAQTPELDLSFGHVAAYARMTVYGLSGENDDIVSVTFSTDADLAGAIDIESGVVTNGSKSVTLDVSSLGYTTADKFDIWFTAAPQENISKFSVGIATKKAEYSKDFAISGSKLLAFRQGVVSNFTINMADAESNNGFIYVEKKGTLEDIINEKGIDAKTLEELRIAGHLNIFDYEYIKTIPNLKLLDLTELEDDELPTGCLEASKIETVMLPKNLIKINNRTFYQAAITSISIPETVEYIGDYAFYHCDSISGNLVIPDSTTYIGDCCFFYAPFDGTLTIGNSVETIGREAFSNCSFTGDLIIPDCVITLDYGAFYRCKNFDGKLVVGNNVNRISSACFASCGFNGTLKIGENVESIGTEAFSDCSGFTGNLVIPDKVTSIGTDSFINCTGFNGYLTIGSAVTTIGYRVFTVKEGGDATSKLNFSKIYCKAVTPPTIQKDTFGRSEYYYPDYLGVPIGSKSKYRYSTTYWSGFKTIEEVDFD